MDDLPSSGAPPGATAFYDSLGGTLGDAILPFLIAYLAYHSVAPKSPTLTIHWSALPAALLGSSLGAVSQFVWLSDPTFGPDWVIPTPHRFSVAGWYHAVYLTSAAGLFSAMAELFIVESRRRMHKNTSLHTFPVDPSLLVGFLILSGGYELTVVHDSFRGKHLTSTNIVTVAIVIVPIILFILLFTSFSRPSLVTTLQIGGTATLGILLLSIILIPQTIAAVELMAAITAILLGLSVALSIRLFIIPECSAPTPALLGVLGGRRCRPRRLRKVCARDSGRAVILSCRVDHAKGSDTQRIA